MIQWKLTYYTVWEASTTYWTQRNEKGDEDKWIIFTKCGWNLRGKEKQWTRVSTRKKGGWIYSKWQRLYAKVFR